ncbi:MAG TPA: tetratricopeptide repeat protein, partial [Saprospiraceae bacterium]|nr:tetratricopeptide repeat protein [Saprospiraceae bacterium]
NMKLKNRYYLLRYALLLIPLFSPVFSNGSVVKHPPLPPQNPTAIDPRQAVGTTDSLQRIKFLLQQNEEKEALQLALNLLKKASLKKDSVLIETSSFLIGQIFSKSKNYEKSLEYYKKSYSLAKKNSKPKYLLNLEIIIGTIYSKIKQPDSATIYYQKVINNTISSPEIELIRSRAYSNLSGLPILKGDLLHAQLNALNALEIQEKYNNALSTAMALNNLASVYLEQKRFADAKRVYFEALELIKNIDNESSLSLKEAIYDNLSWVLFQLKDYRTYIYQEKSFRIRDSLRNEELSGILATIEGRYNAENIKKKEQLKTAEEKREKEHAQNINNILIVISLSLLIGGWLIYRYLKLRQKNLTLELKQQQLIQQNNLEQLQN